MRKSTLIGGLAGLVASMVLVLPPLATAAPGDGGGGTGEVYSDLLVALRDENGVPILSETFFEVGEVDPVPVTCIQPISYEVIPSDPSDPDSPDLPSTPNLGPDGPPVYLVPLQGEASLNDGDPVAEDTACAPKTEFQSYASEVELERLNLVRTSDEVLWKKLAEVGTRLAAADDITLDGAGRITTWTTDPVTLDPVGAAIDASPDQAAIYAATEGVPPAPPVVTDGKPGTAKPGGLMDTGTIPHWLPAATSPDLPLGDPAQIDQGSGGFDNWMLAAAAIGAATGKSVPVTVDTIEYYNRTAADDGDVANWGNVSLLPSIANGDGLFAGDPPPEEFVDYTGFEYTRANVYSGCTTWLDVGTLTWKWDTVMNRVEFIDIVDGASTSEVTNVAGFAQMADDVRSVINYLHNNEVVVDPETGEGFFIDPVFEESCTEQEAMVHRLNEDADRADLTVTITEKPEDETSVTSATFEFEPVIASIWIGEDIVFYCTLDGGAEEECTSPMTYPGLEPGEHTFTVYATAGGTAGLLTTYTWTLQSPLAVTITSAPEKETYETSATFAFEAAGSEVVFYCTLDGGAEEECTSPMTYPGLEPGEHTFTVYATDDENEPLPTDYTWEVKPPGLEVTITSAPTDGTGVTSATFEFEAVDEEGMVFYCTLDEGAEEECTSPMTYGGLAVGVHTFTVYATDGEADGVPVDYLWTVLQTGGSTGGTSDPAPSPAPPAVVPPGDQLDVVSLNPVRLADTRAGWVATDGEFTGTGPVSGGQFVQVPVAGRGGVPAGANGAVVNVTIADPVAGGYATAYPCGTVPFTSSLNYSAGENVANEVFAKLSPTGTICVYTLATANVIVDVAGFVPAGSDLVSLNPVRLADTRAGWVATDGEFTGTGPVSGGQFVQVPVAGRGGVPADATAVVANVTIADPVAGGYATAYPCGTVPFTSSLNYSAGENVANEVFAKLSPTGTICVYTLATANVIVDVAGFVPEGSDLVSLNPVRLADTRAGWVATDGEFTGTGPVSGGQFVQVPVAGRGGVPADATAVVANVTIADPVAGGYATAYPCGTVPFTSSLNYSAGENVANEVFAKLSPTGTICVYTLATANVIVDVAGYV